MSFETQVTIALGQWVDEAEERTAGTMLDPRQVTDWGIYMYSAGYMKALEDFREQMQVILKETQEK